MKPNVSVSVLHTSPFVSLPGKCVCLKAWEESEVLQEWLSCSEGCSEYVRLNINGATAGRTVAMTFIILLLWL